MLLDARPVLFVENEAVEDGENLFTVTVDFLQRFPEIHLEIGRAQPFIEHVAGHVDVLPEVFEAMAAEKEAVEESRLPLRSQGIEIISRRHVRYPDEMPV